MVAAAGLPTDAERRLAEHLVTAGLATGDQVERAIAAQARRAAAQGGATGGGGGNGNGVGVGRACLGCILLEEIGLGGEARARAEHACAARLPGCSTCRARAATVLAGPVLASTQSLADRGSAAMDGAVGTPPPDAPPLFREGELFSGRYRLIARLGKGGMGEVWRAKDERLNRVVALKRILPSVERDCDAARDAVFRFLREAQLSARLEHPHIVRVYDFVEEGGEHFLTMDAIEGRSFAAYLAETEEAKRAGEVTGVVRLEQEVGLLADIAEAVDFAHKNGVLHRDLKPSNCILDAERRVYVLDFGLAKALRPAPGPATEQPEDVPIQLTGAGAMVGTPAYMSPEQTGGRRSDAGGLEELGPASDTWALGVMLYEVLTGRYPFEGGTLRSFLEAIRTRPAVPPRRMNPHLSSDLEAVCLRALEKDPARRYQSAGDFAAELRRWIAGDPAAAIHAFCAQESLARIEAIREQQEVRGGAFVLVQAIRHRALGAGRKDVPSCMALVTHASEVAKEVGLKFSAFEVQPAQKLDGAHLFAFGRPAEAVRFALDLQAASDRRAAAVGFALGLRAAIHVWQSGERGAQAPGHASSCAALELAGRLLSLAGEGEVLCSRTAFDRARVEMPRTEGGKVGGWVSHGAYRLRGADESIEICAVAAPQAPAANADAASMAAPLATDAGRPADVSVDEPGWRPGPGQAVPGTDWVLDRHLGQGGFGEVWSAADARRNGRRVFKFCFEKEKVRSLKREEALFRLIQQKSPDHPNLVRLHEVHLGKTPYYVAMEHVEGPSLRSWLLEANRIALLSIDAKCEIAAQVADALDASAAAGVIHQDVKPDNILVDTAQPLGPGGAPRVKLTDFGVGRVTSEEVLRKLGHTVGGKSLAASARGGGTDSGTLLYMAPERQQEGGRASPQSDLYSLGVVLYQMTVGDMKRSITADAQHAVADPLLREDLGALLAGAPESRPARGAEVAKRLRDRARRGRWRTIRRAGTTLALTGALLLGVAALLRMGSALGTSGYSLALRADPADRGEVHPADARCAAGELLTIEATPQPDWSFKEWSDGDSTNPRSWRMPAMDSTLTARFVPDLEPLGKNEQGMEEFRHVTTGIVLVLLPAGRFRMGSDSGPEDEKPAHDVTLSRPFLLGKFEVTQEQWRVVLGYNSSEYDGDEYPVDLVSWKDCQGFLNKLNRGVTKGGFRLPTEAEWEYSCRAGATTDYCFGDAPERLAEYAWYRDNSGGKTHPVGQKKPNAWGLYDMHGNVLEWCSDWYDEGFYAGAKAGTDPSGPAEERASRVLCGGSWSDFDGFLRAAYRFRLDPGYQNSFAGVRVARSR